MQFQLGECIPIRAHVAGSAGIKPPLLGVRIHQVYFRNYRNELIVINIHSMSLVLFLSLR